jgi:hypothetical protein
METTALHEDPSAPSQGGDTGSNPVGGASRSSRSEAPGRTAGAFVVLHRAIHWLLRPARFQHRSADSPGTRVVVCEQAGDVASDGPFRLVVAGVERFDVNDVIGDLLDVC